MATFAVLPISFLRAFSGLGNYRQEVSICASQACLGVHTLFTGSSALNTLAAVGIVAVEAFVALTLIT